MIKHLSTKALVEAYTKAREINLEKDFIDMLELELRHRSIAIDNKFKNEGD